MTSPFETNKATILAALSAAGILEVTASFNGGGDEGGIDEISPELPRDPLEYVNADWSGNKTGTYNPPLDEAVQDFCYEVIAKDFGGWENGDGGYGTVTIDVQAGTVALDMNTYYTESTNHGRSY